MSATKSGSRGGVRSYDVDQRLVMPETRFEIIEGEVAFVSPAEQPHASRHAKLSALLEAYAADGYDAACDMLTRTGEKSDFAPDGSIYPEGADPETGGRRLEELAFEIVSTERLSAAGHKAALLVERGVRRVFAIDVSRQRGLEWSRRTGAWEILANDSAIEDRVLVLPLPVEALVSAAKADDAVAQALLAKKNRVLAGALANAHSAGKTEGKAEGKAEGRAEGKAEGRAEGKAEAVLATLRNRGLAIPADIESAIRSERDENVLDHWIAGAATCPSAAALLGR